MPRSRRSVLPLVLPVLWLAAAPGASAQLATIRVEENFRMEPNGTVLARLLPGTTVSVEERGDDWTGVLVEGWVWMRSLQATERGGFDLVVAAAEGENLRASPQGAILARLEPGTLLEEAEREPGWIRVRRRGWIWTPSLEMAGTEPAPREAQAPGVSGGASEEEEEEEGAASRPGVPEGADPAGGGSPPVATAPPGGLPVLVTPDGDTLARALPGADLQVLERQGSWARVRLEGWAWMPGRGGGEAGEDPGIEAPVALTPEDVRSDPGRWVGRLVTWELQYVSLERAERVRTDFFEGEPFLLTRLPGGRGPFVYVAVPPERLPDVEGLVPLERIRVTGRVRTGASSLTGSPIVDLLEMRRVGR